VRPPLTEAELLGFVRNAAQALGILCYHTRDSRRCEPGFPDLVLAGERLLFRELKSRNGKLSLEQREWMRALARAGQDVDVWRPADWSGRILRELHEIRA
jgi:hypothetical protein